MMKWLGKIHFFKKSSFIPLRYRFIFLTSLLLLLLLGSLAVALGLIQGKTIRNQLEKRGIAIAQNMVAASMNHLLTYNHVALEQSANQAAQNPGITYVIIHDKEGHVAGYSGRSDLQNRLLSDEVSRRALLSDTPLIQERTTETGPPVLDVAVPVLVNNPIERWGTVRIGLSLQPMHIQIRQMQIIILIIGGISLGAGIVLSMGVAQRITNPLGNLVQATVEAAKGNLDQNIQVATRDEVEILASNFSKMIKDIKNHRQQLEQQLVEIKHLQHYTQKLLTTMSDGLVSLTREGVVAAINPAAQSIFFFFDCDLMNGSSIETIAAPLEPLYSHIKKILEDPSHTRTREITLYKGEKTKTLLIGSSMLTDSDGGFAEVIINLHDITELKILEAHIRQTERLAGLGTLAAGMAHEIRNPLSAIMTFVKLLPQKIHKPNFLDKFQRTVPREINRIDQLVEELLELSRVPKYDFKVVDIQDVLRQTMELMEDELQNHNIQARIACDKDLPLVLADTDQLMKAFINLAKNAAQAMNGGGELDIQARNNDGVTVIIEDTGPGIPQEILDKIFNPFFTTKEKGTGLGLAITHKVITEHGGSIQVESEEGKGTRFIIDLLPHNRPEE